MPVIYEPKGKAREYSPLALNIYNGCTHKCVYCYAPNCLFKSRNEYYKIPDPKKDVSEKVERELKKGPVPDRQVLLSFIGDLYCETNDRGEEGKKVLETLYKYNVPVAVLSKGGTRMLRDIDIFKKFSEKNLIQVGMTLTFFEEKDSLEWEAGAALPADRIETLKTLHKNKIRTFASFEPVISPEQSLRLIEETIEFVDVFKIGKLNNYNEIDKKINWKAFLSSAVDILRKYKKEFYIKEDLRKAAPEIKLYEKETKADLHNVGKIM